MFSYIALIGMQKQSEKAWELILHSQVNCISGIKVFTLINESSLSRYLRVTITTFTHCCPVDDKSWGNGALIFHYVFNFPW